MDRLLDYQEQFCVSLPGKYCYEEVKDVIEETCRYQDEKTSESKDKECESKIKEVRAEAFKEVGKWLFNSDNEGWIVPSILLDALNKGELPK